MDRPTISKLPAKSGARLHYAQIVAKSAIALEASADCFLDIRERPECAAAPLASTLPVSEAAHMSISDRIFEWREEARAFKIRHIPAMLPDMFNYRDILE